MRLGAFLLITYIDMYSDGIDLNVLDIILNTLLFASNLALILLIITTMTTN